MSWPLAFSGAEFFVLLLLFLVVGGIGFVVYGIGTGLWQKKTDPEAEEESANRPDHKEVTSITEEKTERVGTD